MVSIHDIVTSPSTPDNSTAPVSYAPQVDDSSYAEYGAERTSHTDYTDHADRTDRPRSADAGEHTSTAAGHSTSYNPPVDYISSSSSTQPRDMAQNYPDVEKDMGGNSVNGNNQRYDLHHDTHDEDTALKRLRTAGSISISPELFEKIYLSPKNQVSNNLRSTVGNPTPLALAGFLLSLSPLSNTLMGWRGAGGLGAAETAVYYFFGGLLMIIGSILEFILGNTFPFIVFGSFGAFWLTYAGTLTPYMNAATAYGDKGAAEPQFMATFAFFLLYMGLLCFVYLICALRTNVIFILIFATLVPAFGLLASVFWHGSQEIMVPHQQTAAGALTFITCLLGWYLFLVQLLASVDFPLNLPVGDTSRFIKGASERAKAA